MDASNCLALKKGSETSNEKKIMVQLRNGGRFKGFFFFCEAGTERKKRIGMRGKRRCNS